jgi:hypothetical protein
MIAADDAFRALLSTVWSNILLTKFSTSWLIRMEIFGDALLTNVALAYSQRLIKPSNLVRNRQRLIITQAWLQSCVAACSVKIILHMWTSGRGLPFSTPQQKSRHRSAKPCYMYVFCCLCVFTYCRRCSMF